MPGTIVADSLDAMDPAAVQAELASAREAVEAEPPDARLQAQVEMGLAADIARIHEYAAQAGPDDEFVKANQHVLLDDGRSLSAREALAAAATGTETWTCGGSANLTGVVMWALGGTVIFAPPLAFMFGAAGGPDWALGGFASGIAGSFVVDPQKIRDNEMRQEGSAVGTVYKGSCKFQLGSLGAGAGAIRLSFYSNSGTYWGLLGGVTGGVGGASLSGQCDLVWS